MTRGLALLLCFIAQGFTSLGFSQTSPESARSVSPGGPPATPRLRTGSADAPLASPSFDCSKAKEPVDVLLCHDDELAALDLKMARVYRIEMETRPEAEVAAQKAIQLEWMQRRNHCAKSKAIHACVEWNYERRIAELQIRTGLTHPFQTVAYDCPGGNGNKPLSAIFYQETDPPSALITYGSDQVVAILRPSGSGAKYTASSVQFWDQQGEVLVTWSKKKFSCQPRAAQLP